MCCGTNCSLARSTLHVLCLLSILVAESRDPCQYTLLLYAATATSPLAVNVSAMTDGRGLDVTTEMEVGGVVYAFQECTEVCTMLIHVGSCVFVYVRTTYYVTEHSTYTCSTCVYTCRI